MKSTLCIIIKIRKGADWEISPPLTGVPTKQGYIFTMDESVLPVKDLVIIPNYLLDFSNISNQINFMEKSRGTQTTSATESHGLGGLAKLKDFEFTIRRNFPPHTFIGCDVEVCRFQEGQYITDFIGKVDSPSCSNEAITYSVEGVLSKNEAYIEGKKVGNTNSTLILSEGKKIIKLLKRSDDLGNTKLVFDNSKYRIKKILVKDKNSDKSSKEPVYYEVNTEFKTIDDEISFKETNFSVKVLSTTKEGLTHKVRIADHETIAIHFVKDSFNQDPPSFIYHPDSEPKGIKKGYYKKIGMDEFEGVTFVIYKTGYSNLFGTFETTLQRMLEVGHIMYWGSSSGWTEAPIDKAMTWENSQFKSYLGWSDIKGDRSDSFVWNNQYGATESMDKVPIRFRFKGKEKEYDAFGYRNNTLFIYDDGTPFETSGEIEVLRQNNKSDYIDIVIENFPKQILQSSESMFDVRLDTKTGAISGSHRRNFRCAQELKNHTPRSIWQTFTDNMDSLRSMQPLGRDEKDSTMLVCDSIAIDFGLPDLSGNLKNHKLKYRRMTHRGNNGGLGLSEWLKGELGQLAPNVFQSWGVGKNPVGTSVPANRIHVGKSSFTKVFLENTKDHLPNYLYHDSSIDLYGSIDFLKAYNSGNVHTGTSYLNTPDYYFKALSDEDNTKLNPSNYDDLKEETFSLSRVSMITGLEVFEDTTGAILKDCFDWSFDYLKLLVELELTLKDNDFYAEVELINEHKKVILDSLTIHNAHIKDAYYEEEGNSLLLALISGSNVAMKYSIHTLKEFNVTHFGTIPNREYVAEDNKIYRRIDNSTVCVWDTRDKLNYSIKSDESIPARVDSLRRITEDPLIPFYEFVIPQNNYIITIEQIGLAVKITLAAPEGLDSLDNPAALIYKLLKESAHIPQEHFDLPSIERAILLRQSWNCSVEINAPVAINSIVDRLAKEACLFLYENDLGKIAMASLEPPREEDVKQEFNPSNLTTKDFSETYYGLDYLISELQAEYNVTGKVDSKQLSSNLFKKAGEFLNGEVVQVLLKLKYINNEYGAVKSCQIKQFYHAIPTRVIHLYADIDTPLNIGDWAKVNPLCEIPLTEGNIYLIIGKVKDLEECMVEFSLFEFDKDDLQLEIQEVPHQVININFDEKLQGGGVQEVMYG